MSTVLVEGIVLLNKVLDEVEPPFTFAVVGDAHFTLPAFNPGLDREATSLRPLDAKKYIENVEYALSPMLEAFQSEPPAFIVMTGDLVEGNESGDLGRAEMQAGLDFFDACGIPLFFARGNHDRAEAFDGVVLPYLSEHLGLDLQERFYFADVGGCRLVFLDTTDWRRGSPQRAWLENLLRESRDLDIDRIFLFGHHPVWPVARAFFTTIDFQQELFDILSQHPVDAFFCGHTHNQSAILHRTGGLPALQFMGAPIGLPEEMPTPLNLVQALLPSMDDLLACWPGYLENTAPGWFTVQVSKRSVQVEWHHLNRGPEVEVRWYRRGDVTSFWQMPPSPGTRLIESDLSSIRRAVLRYCAWNAMQPGKRVFLNGEEVGELPPGGHFSPMEMDLPARAIERLKMDNRLEIQVPEDDPSTLGNFVLEAILSPGRPARTHPTGEIFVWSDRWDTWRLRRLEKVKKGRPVRTVLSFR